MLGLAIHTASPQLGLMLQSIEGTVEGAVEGTSTAVRRHQVWDLGREVSSQLHVKMMEFVSPYTWQDLSFVAVAKGPGGFTGTRVGVVAARTLAQQLEIPLFGVSTLAALAMGVARESQSASKDIAVMMPAKRGEVFCAIYRFDKVGQPTPAFEDQVLIEAEWAETIKHWDRPLVQIQTAAGEGIANSVVGVSAIAHTRYRNGLRPDWSAVMPFYGQHPVVNC
ncbi:tRNA (adenosine(37)-N6)-threonylcarbamoyltransferase complex dimerization subunit type 1 TsaB [cf. Phormidesmis sp. LEGE 11477]|uniref:tRNA (adenosine(37)-N6)-threonylcarbamoyltransferase complex dimerization subunit type 1 TsaB n=1 Tax=cf. Phormidesmis sp. LEGE 11477 TaxID=1828680 RepID=UPI0018806507|nr:tRNA (adenosine(37)-N6)-threonylcarbamoyltransferase complex dimerization subunit type 1 TsaB [cf. Phormidesmis sp. LEGE 11477]MBE9061232.1 tRNA (adenosine(37)-N6)-threonylcarbamoyltransferase complex dimerization subunit type 1 TsaB [cf. Phormidesmis sp. LEGE 11477]